VLDADADRACLELRLTEPSPEIRVRAHPFAGSAFHSV